MLKINITPQEIQLLITIVEAILGMQNKPAIHPDLIGQAITEVASNIPHKDGVSAAQVIAVLKLVCAVTDAVCPIVNAM